MMQPLYLLLYYCLVYYGAIALMQSLYPLLYSCLDY